MCCWLCLERAIGSLQKNGHPIDAEEQTNESEGPMIDKEKR